MNLPELRRELKARNSKVTGRKHELVERYVYVRVLRFSFVTSSDVVGMVQTYARPCSSVVTNFELNIEFITALTTVRVLGGLLLNWPLNFSYVQASRTLIL